MDASAVDLQQVFTNMLGAAAVILVIAAIIGGSERIARLLSEQSRWKYSIVVGVLGGVLGIYGTMAGVPLNGAIVSVRDVGPMFAGLTGGPLGGLIAGAIAGAHRLLAGLLNPDATVNSKLVTVSCVVATISIGLICGFLSEKYHEKLKKPWWAFLTGAVMEVLHLTLLVLIVGINDINAGWGIVKAIAVPFILINALGFMLMVAIISFIEKQRALTLERSRIQTELDVATTIQRSLLPPVTDTFPGREEIGVAASMDPAKAVGGDFYDVFFVDRDRLAFVIADVSGKGIPAALFMATSKTTIQNCLRDIPSLSRAVATANDNLCRNNTAGMFVTAWIGVLDLTTGTFSFINAGHNPPVLVSDGRAAFIKLRSGFILAGMEGMQYREQTLQLKPGDRFFLYTDGVTEAENNAHALFGDERLAACLEREADRAPDEILAAVRAAVDAHADGADQFDDVTMLCIRYDGPQTDAAAQ